MRLNLLSSRSSVPVSICALLFCLFLWGCRVAPESVGEQASTVLLGGHVYGGQQPVSQATVRLMAVGATGDGSAATSLMTSSVSTDAGGNFTLTGQYNCTTPSTQVYLLSTGGNPGLSAGTNNTALAMMTALGACGSLTSSSYVTINELTTVASVAALLPYISAATSVGSSSADATQLSTAMAMVQQYANTSSGSVPGPALPNGWYASTRELTSLADAVATCINSAGGTAGDGSLCGRLFSYASYTGSTIPTDTIAALINILTVPTNNVSAIFGLIDTQAPFAGGLTTAPATWALPISNSSAGTVQLQSASYGVTEGASNISLTLTRSTSSGAASVNYLTVSGTATAGTDFAATTGTVSWTSGDGTPKTITVPLYNPGAVNGSRSFSVSLSSPQGGVTLGTNATATVTITDSDASLSIATTSLTAANQYASYTASLAATGGVGSYTWSVANSSALPSGLTVSSNGTISGTPTVSGSFTLTVQVQDSATPTPQIAQQSVSLSITSLAAQVANLPTDTAANAIKKAVLTWGVNGAASLSANGDSTGSANLISDVVSELGTTFTFPTTLPAQYFPAIPSIASNPGVAAANKNIGTQLSNDAKTPPVWDDPSYTTVTAGTNLEYAEDMLTAMLTPGQSYYQNATLVPAMLSRMESATWGAVNTYPGDFASAPEIAYFYLQLSQAFPQLMLPSRAAVWKQIIANNTALFVTNFGSYFTNYAANQANWWINADVRNMTSLVYGDLVGGTTSQHTAIVQGAMAEMQAVILPDGGTDYTDQQNEAFTYHEIYLTELTRYARVTGDTSGTTLAAATRYYNALSMVPPGVGEYVTAPSWKKYWNEFLGNNAMEIVVGLTGDQTNQWLLSSVGYPASYASAAFYRSDVAAVAPPSNYITYDRNAQGTRGVAGNFAFMGTTRPTPLSKRGKATFVGAVNVNSTTSGAGWTFNNAIESAGAVILKATGAENVTATTYGANANLVNLAANENNASTTTSSFGALSTVHNLSGYQGTPTSWLETEGWILLPTRVIGLVTVKNTASEKAFELDGGFKLVSGRSTWGTQKTVTQLSSNLWTYGSSTIQVYANDYASSRYELANTWEDTAQKAAWIFLTDANNSTTTAYTYPAGTSHYFLADFRPSTSAAATGVQKLTLTTGLVGFSFQDGGVTYTLIQNTTSSAIAYTAPSGATVTPSGAQYRVSFVDPNGNTGVAASTYTGSIPAYQHIVMTQ